MKPKLSLFIQERLKEDFLPDKMMQRLHEISEPEIMYNRDDYDRSEVERLFKRADAVISSWGMPNVDEELIGMADNLKILSHAAGQIRDFIPEAIFDLKPDIVICNVSDVMAKPVAEHMLMSAIIGLRNVRFFNDWLREGHDGWWDYDLSKNRSLINRKVGIVGMGQIAWEFVRLARPFNVDLCVYSRHMKDEVAEKEGLTKLGLEELISTCDVICLSAADTEANFHMINSDLIRKIKDGAVFVNNARGRLVDEKALIEELKTGRFNAVIDVTEEEPPAPDNELRTLPNVYLFPHIGGPTPDQWYWMMSGAVDNVERFFKGEEVRSIIDRNRYNYMA